jgi:hypothetical protein
VHLVELSVMKQCYQAVMAVDEDGWDTAHQDGL